MIPVHLVLAASIGSAPRPVPVVNGEDATACQFPSVVALLTEDGVQFCTGSLVAPRIVLTAGHCIDAAIAPPAARVLFGEDIGAPALLVDVEACVLHPDYEVLFDAEGVGTDLAADIGFCRLAADAPPVPIVPMAAGCEAESFVAGGELFIIGFGATAGGVTRDGEKWGEGNGTKRYKAQTIEVVDATMGEVVLTSPDGSACFGDSGGPTMGRLADGTWRIAGVGSALHPDDPTQCGLGATYELVGPHVAWLEDETGVDLTPCFADDGAWAPTDACSEFPSAPLDGGDWMAACAGVVSGPGASCAPAQGGESSSSGGGDDTTGAPVDPDTGSGSSETSSDGGAPVDGDPPGDAGCGCAPGRRPGLAWIALLALARRRPRASLRRSDLREDPHVAEHQRPPRH